MYQRVKTLCLCLFTVTCALVGTQVQAKSLALLVGVGDYQSPQLDIPGVDRDLAKAKLMMHRFGVAERNITVLFNEQASVPAVEAQLIAYQSKLQKDDQLFVYFSAHGLQLDDDNDDEADGRDEALALAGFSVGPKGDNAKVSGVLLDDRLAELLAALPNKYTLVIADTCHSGSISKGLSDVMRRVGKFIQMPSWLVGESDGHADSAFREISQPGVALLSAAADGELADIDVAGSAFTQALLNTQGDPSKDILWCWYQRARQQVWNDTGGVQWPQFGGAFELAVQSPAGKLPLAERVALMQSCSAAPGFSTGIMKMKKRLRLSARATQSGWVTPVAMNYSTGALEMRPQASRWHHGDERSIQLGRARSVPNNEAGALIVWTAEGVELPRHRGDFAILWNELRSLHRSQWASSVLQGVDLNVR